MSGRANTTYNTTFDQTRSPMTASHLGSPTASLSQLTFKTNVTRQKSKRWAEAKAGVYDGGGWGDDEYDDEYDDEPYPPLPSLPQGVGGAGLQRRSSFERGDDGLSPTTGSRGNGVTVPRIEAVEVGVVQSLPPTPLELEQREKAFRAQSPPYTQQQYPMQPRPQFPKIPYIIAPNSSSPARTPPLPSQAVPGSSYSNSKELPQPPSIDEIPPPPVKKDFPVRQPNEIRSAPGIQIKDKVPPPLGVPPVISTPAPPPPPKPTFSGGMKSPSVAKPAGYSPSPPLVEEISISGQAYEPAGVQEPPSFPRKGSPALENGPAVPAQPSPVSTPSPPPSSSSPLPPPPPPPLPAPVQPPQVEPEFMEEEQALPPPALAEDADAQIPPSPQLPLPDDTAVSVISDDNGSQEPSDWSQEGHEYDDFETEGQQSGHVGTDQVHYPSYSPQTEYIASPPQPVGPSEQLASPRGVVTATNPEDDRSREESDWQDIGGDVYPGAGVDSQGGGISPPAGEEDHLHGAQTTDMVPLSGSESTEPSHELGEHLGNPGNPLSDRGYARPKSPAGSRPASRQGGSPTSPHLQTGALTDAPSTTAVVRTPPYQFDPATASGEEKDQTARYSYWNDDIIAGYATNSPDGPQYTAPFHEPPQQAYGGGVSLPPTLMTSLPTPDFGKSFPPFEAQKPENLGFRSMVDHAFSGQDGLVPTPVTPGKDLTYAPAYIISPILPREIPLPKSPSPPIFRAPVAPPKSPSPPLLSTPTPPSKSLTPPGRQETPSSALGRDQVGSSSPRNSIGPERTATPVFPPVAIHGVAAELDQVPSDPAGFKNENSGGSKVPSSKPLEAKQGGSHEGPTGNSGTNGPGKNDLDRFSGELVRAQSPAPRDGAPSPQPWSSRGLAGGSDRTGPEVENARLSGPQVQSMALQESQSQQSETQPPSSRGPEYKRESAGGLSLYDSYWTEEEAAPPPIQPKSSRRPSANLDTEAVKQELDLLAHQNGQTSAPPQPAGFLASSEQKRSGVTLPPVAIPDNKLSSDPLLMTPASALGTPDSELVEMNLARKHYLARTHTGLSTRSDSMGQRVSDEDVTLRVKGDERMSWKPGNVVTPDAGNKDGAREVVVGSGGEAGPQVKRSDAITPTRVIGPDSEGIEAIGGPTRVPKKVPPEGDDNDGERTPLQSDFARELVNQFSRPQTLMLKDTMPMPAGLLLMPPMPPKTEGEEQSPDVVDFSKDGDEEDVEKIPDAQANLAPPDKLTQERGSKDADVDKMNRYMEPRDIMKLPHPLDRADAYNQASNAIARADTGLGNWINWMMKENGGEDLLKIETGQGPVNRVSSLRESASRDLGGAEGISPKPNQPSVAHSHSTNAGWAPQNPGTSTGGNSQVSGDSTGSQVGPVVDKAKGFFNRFSKKGHKDAHDASSLSPAQRGSSLSTPGPSLRTFASSGSFQNSFTASGLVGAQPPNGNHNKQGLPQPQSMPHLQPVHQPGSGLPHSHGFQTQQSLRQPHNYEPVTDPSSDQGISREQGVGQGQGRSQALQGEQSQQGPVGQVSLQGPPKPTLPQPPAKDRLPQLIIPGQRQQVIIQSHPAGHVQNMPDRGLPPSQQDPQATGGPPPETGQEAPRSHKGQESTGLSQSPTGNSSGGRTIQNQRSPPPLAQHSFPKRTDSLLSRSQRQQSARASPISVGPPERTDSLTLVQGQLPKNLQQPKAIASDGFVAPVQPSGQTGHSGLVSSSIVNSPVHSDESGPSSSHNGHNQHKQNSFAWAPTPQMSAGEQGQQQHQSGGQGDQSQEPNPVARSYSSRLPLHSDGHNSHDQASVGRSQSYHSGGYLPDGNQQQGSMYGRRGPHPEPIHENSPTPRKPDDDADLYAPPPGLRIQEHSTPGDSGGPGLQRPGPVPRAPEQSGSVHPRQDIRGQQPRQPDGALERANQMPRQTPPVPDYRITTLPQRQYPPPGSNQSKQVGVPNYPDRYNPGFQPRITGYQLPSQQALQQGHFRQVSAGAVGAPGPFSPKQSYPQSEADRRDSSGLVKTLSNVSGNRQSTDTGSFDPHSGNQYAPSTSSSQDRRRSNFFSSLTGKVEQPGRSSPNQSVDPKVAGKPQKRGSSFLKLKKGDGSKDKKGEGSKEKKNSGVVGGKSTHKKGFSDVFGRTGSMLGKALSKPSSSSPVQPPAPLQNYYPSPPPQKYSYPSPPPPGYPSPPPQGYPSPPPQTYPSPPALQQRQPQPIDPKQGQVGPQERGPNAANPNMYYYQPKQPLPPQGPSAGNRNSAQQQGTSLTGTQSPPPPAKTPDPPSQQAQPKTDSQEPQYDPVPIPTGYSRPQGEFRGAYIPEQPDDVPNQQPQQSQQPTSSEQQVPTQADPSQTADGRAPTEQVYSRPASEQRLYRQSPDLSRPGTQTSRAQGVSPSLTPQLSRQGTRASHTRSISPQISNIDVHSVRNAPMSSLSEGATIPQTELNRDPSEGEGSPAAQFRSPTQISPRSSLRDSNQAQFVPSPTHTPPPATPQGSLSPLRGVPPAPLVPVKVLPTPPPGTPTPGADQGPRSQVAGNAPQIPTPLPQRARSTSPTEGGKAPQTFYADDSGSERVNTPDRVGSPQKPIVADYSEEKIAIQDGVEVEPAPRNGDTEDEPVMSATAYPGQAWDPTVGW